jgi:hypothetical protein
MVTLLEGTDGEEANVNLHPFDKRDLPLSFLELEPLTFEKVTADGLNVGRPFSCGRIPMGLWFLPEEKRYSPRCHQEL